MDAYGNPIPGPSNEFSNEKNTESISNYDFAWLEQEFNNEDVNEDVKVPTSIDQSLNTNDIFKFDKIKTNPNIQEFFEEIKCIDFSQNQNLEQNNYTLLELLEQCNKFIDIVGRNIVYLEDIMVEINSNIEISKRNVNLALSCLKFENNHKTKITTRHLKKKAYLANFFKIGLSNCPQNPHLMELYETGRLILSYNGRFILEECVETNIWNQEFKNKLETEIHSEVLNKLKIPMLEQHLHLGLERNKQSDPLVKNKIEMEMFDIEKELKIIAKMPFKQLVFQFMDSDTKYDWLHIAKEINKPDLQCQRFWNLILKPHISRSKWTKSEDENLIRIATYNGEKNWQKISDELGTNRNELQCFVHYQKYKKVLYKKGKWSKQEDQKLSEIVKENSIDNIINWQRVYFAMFDEGRSVDQIYNRWMHCLKPGIKKGVLSDREKFIIKEAKLKNLPPSVVSMNLTNRTSTQVRNAYRRIGLYDEDIYRGCWTVEEDKMLLLAVNPYAAHELTWSKVSQQVPGRNEEQCRHRFKLIEKKIQSNPKLTVDKFTRNFRAYKPKQLSHFPECEDDQDLQKKFKHNRQLLKISDEPVETDNDRKLKKSYLENKFVIEHCNLPSKCALYKYVLDYLGADLVVPTTFAHKDDLIDDGLMSVMSYISECNIELSEATTFDSNQAEHNLNDTLLTDSFTYEGVHGVLRTSDIINSDISEIEGLLDIRIRNIQLEQPYNGINFNNSIKKCTKDPLPLSWMGSVPPNHETFKMLYTYINYPTTTTKTHRFRDPSVHFDWDDEESRKLHQRLVAIFRLPALFSNLSNYNTAKINMIVNADEVETSNSYSTVHYTQARKKKPILNLKNYL